MASKRIEMRVTMKAIYSYEAKAYGYGYETRYIYKMVDDNDNVFVWKTTSFMTIEVPYTGKKGCHNWTDRKGNPVDYMKINKGDIIRIKATIKGESEYNGEKQTELTRLNVLSREFAGETYEEMIERKEREKAERVKAQYDSIKGGDFVWRMPYRQYKEHYSDCETIEGSYEEPETYRRAATIKVIIREGRLKASGVRGMTYAYFHLAFRRNNEDRKMVFKAVCFENAVKQLLRVEPDAEDIKVDKIYR